MSQGVKSVTVEHKLGKILFFENIATQDPKPQRAEIKQKWDASKKDYYLLARKIVRKLERTGVSLSMDSD